MGAAKSQPIAGDVSGGRTSWVPKVSPDPAAPCVPSVGPSSQHPPKPPGIAPAPKASSSHRGLKLSKDTNTLPHLPPHVRGMLVVKGSLPTDLGFSDEIRVLKPRTAEHYFYRFCTSNEKFLRGYEDAVLAVFSLKRQVKPRRVPTETLDLPNVRCAVWFSNHLIQKPSILCYSGGLA